MGQHGIKEKFLSLKQDKEALKKQPPKRQIHFWQQKDKRFSRRIRYHIVQFYRQIGNSLLPYYEQYANFSEDHKKEIKYQFQISKQFCLRDKETAIEITAWYICFHELLQYFDRLEANSKDVEDRQLRSKLKKDNIQKVLNSWVQLYPIRLEERREALRRQQETMFIKWRRTLSACFRIQATKQETQEKSPLRSAEQIQ